MVPASCLLLKDAFYSKYDVLENESQNIVHLETPSRAIVASLTESTGNIQSTKFDFATTTWTLTPITNDPSSTRVDVSGTIRSTSWLANMFAENVSALVKNTTELSFEHLEFGGRNRLSPGTCEVSN